MYIRDLMLAPDSISQEGKPKSLYRSVIIIALALYVFLLSINLISTSFGLLGAEVVESILNATANPFIGLFIGLLTTAIIQSSSTVTTMTVAAVAGGSISFESAIPIIMGANVGTTVTSTIVSLGYLTKKSEFRKAISAGTAHDIFNIAVVVILFPLELKFHFLSDLSRYITSLIHTGSNSGTSEPEFGINTLMFEPIANLLGDLISNPFILLIISFFLLFGTIKILSKIIYRDLIGRSKTKLEDFVFKTKYRSFGWGLLITSAIQSSSVTTSLMVPLVATGKVKLRRAFQFILGANIGTTITALIAALFRSEAAISLAIAHLMFNLIGVLIFLPFPWVSLIPIKLSRRLGALTLKYRMVGFAYILVVFFLIPFALIYISSDNKIADQNVIEKKTFTSVEKEPQNLPQTIQRSADY